MTRPWFISGWQAYAWMPNERTRSVRGSGVVWMCSATMRQPSRAAQPHTATPKSSHSISRAVSAGMPAQAFRCRRPACSSTRKLKNTWQSRCAMTFRQSDSTICCGWSLASNWAVTSESSRVRSSCEGSELLIVKCIQRVGEVRAERFEQGDLLHIECAGIPRIERQLGDRLAAAAERKCGRGEEAETQGRRAPRGGLRIDGKIFVDDRPVLPNARPARSGAERAVDLDLDSLKIVGRPTRPRHGNDLPAPDFPNPGQRKLADLRDDPAHFRT